LLSSNVFQFDFDFDEWPGTHENDGEYLRPYNESIFNIRQHYKTVFPEEEFDPSEKEDGTSKVADSGKIYKIRYTINLLPILGNHILVDPVTKERHEVNADTKLMSTCTESEELSLFNAPSLQDVIQFKWDQYGFRHHMVGFCFHVL